MPDHVLISKTWVRGHLHCHSPAQKSRGRVPIPCGGYACTNWNQVTR